MNNSKLVIDSVPLTSEEPVDYTPQLREKESETIKIIDALQKLQQTKEWHILKETIFEGLTETLNKAITTEARQENPDTLKLNRLAGQLKWAERYSNLEKLEALYRTDLTNIRSKLYGQKES